MGVGGSRQPGLWERLGRERETGLGERGREGDVGPPRSETRAGWSQTMGIWFSWVGGLAKGAALPDAEYLTIST